VSNLSRPTVSILTRTKDLANLAGREIMIVDESQSLRALLRHYLEPLNATILDASTGREALDLSKGLNDLAIIILGIQMPEMDGLEFAECVQNEIANGTRRRVPIVMITSESTRDIAVRAQKFGVNSWIMKPPRQDVLLKMVTRLVQKSTIAA